MNTIVVKFGGSSLADANQFRKVANIVKSDSARRFVVASAPGKRNSADSKVTDLLYKAYDLAAAKEDFSSVLDEISLRFASIAAELSLDFDIASETESLRTHLSTSPNRDYMASRGEYLNSKLLAAYLDFPFIDATEGVTFYSDGSFDAETTNEKLKALLSGLNYAVIPGFYGAMPDGTIHTFSRGGSDLTGSIVARAVNADLYENWTDVSGLLAADPRIVENPHIIEYITYRELRELSYMGASVLHEDAVFPVRAAGIPINIRNTNRPEDAGSMIVAKLPEGMGGRVVTGIAGNRGFSSIMVEKSMMNGEIGFGARFLSIFASHGIPFEHAPSGIDTMSVLVNTAYFEPHRQAVLNDIHSLLHPDAVYVEDDLALIAVVGHCMVATKGTAARVFGAIAKADINVRMIDQGSSELNIIIGVSGDDYKKAIRAIYKDMEDLM